MDSMGQHHMSKEQIENLEQIFAKPMELPFGWITWVIPEWVHKAYSFTWHSNH